MAEISKLLKKYRVFLAQLNIFLSILKGHAEEKLIKILPTVRIVQYLTLLKQWEVHILILSCTTVLFVLDKWWKVLMQNPLMP